MSDIIERLHSYARTLAGPQSSVLMLEAADEIARLRERVRVLERLKNEVLWLRAFEHDLREVIGYTNWNALMEKATDAAKAMEERP